MNLREILAGGQDRRAKLDATLDKTLNYYLGPTGIPQRLSALGILNPVNDLEQAGQKAKTVFSGDATGRERFNAGVGMATDMATVLAPVAASSKVGGDATQAVIESLMGFGSTTREGLQDAGRRFAGDEAGAVPLRGGGMSDPSQTGWTFRDMDRSLTKSLSGAENKRIAGDTARVEELPIRQMYATQPTVNPDFAATSSSAGELPLVVRKDGKLFVMDGHHRLTKTAEDGAQTARTRFIDLDGRETGAPLLDYRPEQNAFTAADDDLLTQLLGDQQPQTKADKIAAMLREGRASEVTDEMMGALGPNDQMRLARLYEDGATGVPMPMDEASRMARAEDMGFMNNYETYHGTGDDIQAFRTSFRPDGEGGMTNVGVYSAYQPKVAETYAPNVNGGNIMPLATRSTFDDVVVDAGGANWNAIGMDAHVRRGGTERPLGEAFRGAEDSTGLARTNTIAREAVADGAGSLRIDNTLDIGGYYDPKAGFNHIGAHDIRTDFYPHNIRSRFARFDPRLKHLANLSAGGAAALPLGALLANYDQNDEQRKLREFLQ